MDAIYQFKNIQDNDFRSLGLIKKGEKVIPFEKTHENVYSKKKARKESIQYIIPRLFNACNSFELNIYTNMCETPHYMKELSETHYNTFKTKNITFYDNYRLNKYTHDESFVDINNMWKIANFLGFSNKHKCNPGKKPEPPYEIYTDASFWWDKKENSASIGFIVVGDNGGVYSSGKPIENVEDNNIAECQAVFYALKTLPTDTDITINTDSRYVYTNIHENYEDNGGIVENINREIEKFNSSIINQVSRSVTEVADIFAEICQDEQWVFGDSPKY